jgi:hypothetical protein
MKWLAFLVFTASSVSACTTVQLEPQGAAAANGGLEVDVAMDGPGSLIVPRRDPGSPPDELESNTDFGASLAYRTATRD